MAYLTAIKMMIERQKQLSEYIPKSINENYIYFTPTDQHEIL